MQHIKDIIKSFLKKTNINHVTELNFIIENWEKIVGKEIANNTVPIKLYRDKLFVNVENSVIMQEMNYKKKEIIDKINTVFKEKKINNIIFKIHA